MEYCLSEQLDFQCSGDEIIAVERARYGRMQVGRCVKGDYGHIGCAADVTDILAAACSGQRRCRVDNIGRMFDASNQCPIDLIRYLEAELSCVRGP